MRLKRNKRHGLCPQESYRPSKRTKKKSEVEIIKEELRSQLFGIGNLEKGAIRDDWEEMETIQIQAQI